MPNTQAISLSGTAAANGSYANASFSSGQTAVSAHSSTDSTGVFELGSYSGGSFNLSSFSASGSSTDSLGLTLTQSQSGLETSSRSGSQSLAYTGGDAAIGYNSQSNASFTAVSSTSLGLTVTLSAMATTSFFEAGVYSGGSFSLTSVVQQQSESATQSSTSVAQSSSTSDGTNKGTFSLGGQVAFQGNGTFHNSEQSSDTLQDSRSFTLSVYAAGTISGFNAPGLSSFSFAESSTDSTSESRQSSGTESFNGTGQQGTFSGTGTTSNNASATQSVSSGWNEQGQLQNGAWNLNSLSYSVSAQASFSLSKAVNDSWTGQYSGNDSFYVSGSGNGSFTEQGAGSYGNNTYTLSSYSLTGSSVGSFSQSETGKSGVNSYAHTDVWGETVTQSEAGSYGAGAFSYTSYSHVQTTLETMTELVNQAYDKKVIYDQVQTTGTGHSGVQSETSWGTYTFNTRSPETYNDPKPNQNVSLQGHSLGLQEPETELMPLSAGVGVLPGVALQGVPGATLPVALQGGMAWLQLYGGATNGNGAAWLVTLTGMVNGELSQGGSVTAAVRWQLQLGGQGGANGPSGLVLLQASVQGMGPLLQPGSGMAANQAWSWQGAEARNVWLGVGQGMATMRDRAIQAEPTQDPLGMQASRDWDTALAGLSENASTSLNYGWRAVDAAAGAVDGLTGGLLQKASQLAGTSTWGSLFLGSLGDAAGQVNYWGHMHQYGQYAGRAAAIALTIIAPQSGILGALNLGVMGGGVVSGVLGGINNIRAGNYKAAALELGMSVAAVVEHVPTCVATAAVQKVTKGLLGAGAVAAVGMAARGVLTVGGMVGVYQNGQAASEAFAQGDVLGGVLSLGQMGADSYAMTRSCFTGEMLLDVAGGKKRADAIAVGDRVWSRPEGEPEGELALKAVEEVFIRVAPILEVTVGGQKLRTTAEHPFWMEGRQAWVPAWDLRPGEELRTRFGGRVAVEGVRDSGEVTTVYNWRIADYHTYFVSATELDVGIWSHNRECTPDDVKEVAKDISHDDAVLAADMINRGRGSRTAVQEFLEYNGADPAEAASFLDRFGLFEESTGPAYLEHVGAGKLTASEAAEIQAIVNEFNATVYVVGSRAAGRGNNIDTDLPVGHDPITTRSDIDFRYDARHPRAAELAAALRRVGNGAGTAGPQYDIGDPTRPLRWPYLEFVPDH